MTARKLFAVWIADQMEFANRHAVVAMPDGQARSANNSLATHAAQLTANARTELVFAHRAGTADTVHCVSHFRRQLISAHSISLSD